MNYLALIAALAAISLAAPHPHPPPSLRKRSFQVESHGRRPSPLQEVARTHRKFGWDPIVADDHEPDPMIVPNNPDSVIIPGTVVVVTLSATALSLPTGYGSPPVQDNSSVSGTSSGASTTPTPTSNPGSEDGEVTATPEENESEYLSPVLVGGQELNLNFDTGSADLWVFSTSLSRADVKGHAAFSPNKSSTWSEYEDGTWSITYGDQSYASGTVGFDTVDVGGATVKNQCVEIATDVSPQFVEDENSDGLLGLAFSTISTVQPEPQKTFFENVRDDLTLPVFTSALEESDGKATYEFGKIDSDKHRGKIYYTPVDNSAGWWQFNSPSYAVDGVSTPCPDCSPVIADTGTSLIYMDSEIVAAYYESIRSAQNSRYGYAFLCEEKLPSLSIAIGDAYVATINGSDMTYASLDDGSGYCLGGLQPGPGRFQILGGVFLKQFFAVFDGGEELRFGVALKN